MIEKRFFCKEFDDFEFYYDRKQEYKEGYKCMGGRLAPMSTKEIVDLLNENEDLREKNMNLEEENRMLKDVINEKEYDEQIKKAYEELMKKEIEKRMSNKTYVLGIKSLGSMIR